MVFTLLSPSLNHEPSKTRVARVGANRRCPLVLHSDPVETSLWEQALLRNGRLAFLAKAVGHIFAFHAKHSGLAWTLSGSNFHVSSKFISIITKDPTYPNPTVPKQWCAKRGAHLAQAFGMGTHGRSPDLVEVQRHLT